MTKPLTMTKIMIFFSVLAFILAVVFWLDGGESAIEPAMKIIALPAIYIVSRFVVIPLIIRIEKTSKPEHAKAGIMILDVAILITTLYAIADMTSIYMAKEGWIAASLSDETHERFNGIYMGIIFIVMGNYMPKIIAPLTENGCNPARHQAFQRQVGWLFVLTGILYVVVWLALTPELANIIATSALGLCFLLVIPRSVYYMIKSARSKKPVDT